LGGLRTHGPSSSSTEPLLHKGPAEALPEIPTEVIGCDAGGCLTRELIRQVIASHRDQLKYCYESLLNRYPDLSGKVAVKFLIRAPGDVAQAEVSESTAHNAQLEQCLAQRVRGWLFPAAKSATQVSYPFVFHRAGG
jgi:TonB family protein